MAPALRYALRAAAAEAGQTKEFDR